MSLWIFKHSRARARGALQQLMPITVTDALNFQSVDGSSGPVISSTEYCLLATSILSYAVLVPGEQFGGCTGVFSFWIYIEIGGLFCLRLTHYLKVLVRARSRRPTVVEKFLKLALYYNLVPFQATWNTIGSVWLFTKGSCLPTMGAHWAVAGWIMIGHTVVAMYFFSIYLKCCDWLDQRYSQGIYKVPGLSESELTSLRRRRVWSSEAELSAAVEDRLSSDRDDYAIETSMVGSMVADGDVGRRWNNRNISGGPGAVVDNSGGGGGEWSQNDDGHGNGGAAAWGGGVELARERDDGNGGDGGDGGSSFCVICAENINGGDTVVILRCRHTMHNECLVEWLRRKNQCPACRLPVVDRYSRNRRRRGAAAGSGGW